MFIMFYNYINWVISSLPLLEYINIDLTRMALLASDWSANVFKCGRSIAAQNGKILKQTKPNSTWTKATCNIFQALVCPKRLLNCHTVVDHPFRLPCVKYVIIVTHNLPYKIPPYLVMAFPKPVKIINMTIKMSIPEIKYYLHNGMYFIISD